MPVSVKRVQRALRSVFHVAKYMGVDHGRLNVLMSEKALHLSYVDPAHKELRGETVSEGVHRGGFHDPGLSHGILDSFLNYRVADMMPPDNAASRVY